MAAKLLMRWNIRAEIEDSEYYEFLVHEFIPGMNKLGIAEIQVWATAYGECEQKLVSGITQTTEHMKNALDSEEWVILTDKLANYVEQLGQKVIPATQGFQI
jgi:phage-related minor tail protein